MGEKPLMVVINPATVALGAQVATAVLKKGSKETQELSLEYFKFDFAGLILKIAIFFTFAYIINKIFEAIILGGTVLNAFTGLLGIKLPSSLPQPVIDFFTVGFRGFKFWDIVKILATLLVIVEAFQYIEAQKIAGAKPSPFTLGVFGILVTGLSLITFPELVQKIKEGQILAK